MNPALNVQRDKPALVRVADTGRTPAAFAVRLASARKDDFLSVEDAARAAGVDRETYVKWESGKALPTTNQLLTLVNNCGISSRWLMEGVLPMRKPGAHSDAALVANINELVRCVRLKKYLVGRIADLRKTLPNEWAADLVRAAATPQSYE